MQEAFAFGARVPLRGNEFRLLVWMAFHALDSDSDPIYFAGREKSALALGYLVPDQPWPEHPEFAAIEKQRASAFEIVRRATVGLEDCGAIERKVRGSARRRAVYGIRLTPA